MEKQTSVIVYNGEINISDCIVFHKLYLFLHKQIIAELVYFLKLLKTYWIKVEDSKSIIIGYDSD